MTKRKRTNRNNGLQEQKLHTKLQIEQHESKKTRCELGCVGRVCSSCSTSVTCRVTLVKNPVTAMNQERMDCDYDNGKLWSLYKMSFHIKTEMYTIQACNRRKYMTCNTNKTSYKLRWVLEEKWRKIIYNRLKYYTVFVLFWIPTIPALEDLKLVHSALVLW